LCRRKRERERERNLSAVAREFNQRPRATSFDLSFLPWDLFFGIVVKRERERTRIYIKKTSPRERERIRNVFRLFEHVFEGIRISISEDNQIVVCARISRNERPLNAPLFIHRLQPRKESKKFQRAREISKELNFGGSELWAATIRTSGFARQRKER